MLPEHISKIRFDEIIKQIDEQLVEHHSHGTAFRKPFGIKHTQWIEDEPELIEKIEKHYSETYRVIIQPRRSIMSTTRWLILYDL